MNLPTGVKNTHDQEVHGVGILSRNHHLRQPVKCLAIEYVINWPKRCSTIVRWHSRWEEILRPENERVV